MEKLIENKINNFNIKDPIFDNTLIFCITPVWLFNTLGQYEIVIISISILICFILYNLI